MSRIHVGDTVAFRREVARRCNSKGISDFRAVVTEVAGEWLFMTEPNGRIKVMPAASMCRIGRNGAIFRLVA